MSSNTDSMWGSHLPQQGGDEYSLSSLRSDVASWVEAQAAPGPARQGSNLSLKKWLCAPGCLALQQDSEYIVSLALKGASRVPLSSFPALNTSFKLLLAAVTVVGETPVPSCYLTVCLFFLSRLDECIDWWVSEAALDTGVLSMAVQSHPPSSCTLSRSEGEKLLEFCASYATSCLRLHPKQLALNSSHRLHQDARCCFTKLCTTHDRLCCLTTDGNPSFSEFIEQRVLKRVTIAMSEIGTAAVESGQEGSSLALLVTLLSASEGSLKGGRVSQLASCTVFLRSLALIEGFSNSSIPLGPPSAGHCSASTLLVSLSLLFSWLPNTADLYSESSPLFPSVVQSVIPLDGAAGEWCGEQSAICWKLLRAARTSLPTTGLWEDRKGADTIASRWSATAVRLTLKLLSSERALEYGQAVFALYATLLCQFLAVAPSCSLGWESMLGVWMAVCAAVKASAHKDGSSVFEELCRTMKLSLLQSKSQESDGKRAALLALMTALTATTATDTAPSSSSEKLLVGNGGQHIFREMAFLVAGCKASQGACGSEDSLLELLRIPSAFAASTSSATVASGILQRLLHSMSPLTNVESSSHGYTKMYAQVCSACLDLVGDVEEEGGNPENSQSMRLLLPRLVEECILSKCEHRALPPPLRLPRENGHFPSSLFFLPSSESNYSSFLLFMQSINSVWRLSLQHQALFSGVSSQFSPLLREGLAVLLRPLTGDNPLRSETEVTDEVDATDHFSPQSRLVAAIIGTAEVLKESIPAIRKRERSEGSRDELDEYVHVRRALEVLKMASEEMLLCLPRAP